MMGRLIQIGDQKARHDDAVDQMSTGSDAVQQRLAEERTDMAVQRTALSNERTLNSWLRTALATMAAGFTIGQLLGQEGAVGPARVFGTFLLLAGGLLGVAGLARYRSLRRRLAGDSPAPVPVWLLEVLAGVFLIISLVGAYYLLTPP